jgi:penicillin-binding protein 1A
MKYAHQGIELKNIPGIAPNPAPGTSPQAQVAVVASTDASLRPAVLTRRGADALRRLEGLMDDATRALTVADKPAPTDRQSALPRPGTVAAAAGTTGLAGN